MINRLTALLLLLVATSCTTVGCASPQAEQQQPNIVIILTDDLGFGDVSCYNAESKVQTTHLDALAKQGMRFTDAHSPATVCTPTRFSLMTGKPAYMRASRSR